MDHVYTKRLSKLKITYVKHNLHIGLNNIYFEKLSHTNVQNEQSGFGRKLQACKDHLPIIYILENVLTHAN